MYFGLGDRFDSNLKLCFIRMLSLGFGFKWRLLNVIVLAWGGVKEVMERELN